MCNSKVRQRQNTSVGDWFQTGRQTCLIWYGPVCWTSQTPSRTSSLFLTPSAVVHQFRTRSEEPDGYFFTEPGVFGLAPFLEMVGILEGLAPPPGRRGVSEVSEQTDRESWSSEASEASLPRRLLALLPAWLPARLVAPLAPRFGSEREKKNRG